MNCVLMQLKKDGGERQNIVSRNKLIFIFYINKKNSVGFIFEIYVFLVIYLLMNKYGEIIDLFLFLQILVFYFNDNCIFIKNFQHYP